MAVEEVNPLWFPILGIGNLVIVGFAGRSKNVLLKKYCKEEEERIQQLTKKKKKKKKKNYKQII